jgi:hypothetical protein
MNESSGSTNTRIEEASSLTGLGVLTAYRTPPLKRWAILCRPETGLKQTDDASPHSTCNEFFYRLTYKQQGKVPILQI